MFNGCWSSASGDIEYSKWHVTSENTWLNDHVTLLMGGLHVMSLPSQVWYL